MAVSLKYLILMFRVDAGNKKAPAVNRGLSMHRSGFVTFA